MCNSECNKAFKIDENFDINNYSCEKCLIGKVAWECEGKILNTTEDLIIDKKVACSKK